MTHDNGAYVNWAAGMANDAVTPAGWATMALALEHWFANVSVMSVGNVPLLCGCLYMFGHARGWRHRGEDANAR